MALPIPCVLPTAAARRAVPNEHIADRSGLMTLLPMGPAVSRSGEL